MNKLGFEGAQQGQGENDVRGPVPAASAHAVAAAVVRNMPASAAPAARDGGGSRKGGDGEVGGRGGRGDGTAAAGKRGKVEQEILETERSYVKVSKSYVVSL